ncbi:ABC transporter ATP-binding protein [Litorimonas sp. RW-G-Af-16]|uniref:ABC transporter ATP-binding protein n=1 Tax=Litorimonas sp. RW-G-Af-16 TaxID=3241168 RepID=UPI003AAF80C6
MPAPIVLQTEHLNVHYGDHHALKDLNISINEGELVAVIGPNGAGKTSFIKALCGRIKPDGVMKVGEKLLKRGGDRRRHIGLVPQDIGLYPHLSASENLHVIAKLLRVPRADRLAAINDAIKAVGMEDKADALVETLSGGMKRRINVAAAIMHDPAIIIFDEPTAGVDTPARDVVHRLARTLAERGMAVILVTHELEQAEALCDKVLVLFDGATLAFDTPSRILNSSFAGAREVVVRFTVAPDAQTLAAMRPFAFEQGEMPTVWVATTQANEVSFVSAFMTALRGGNEIIREITVRRLWP